MMVFVDTNVFLDVLLNRTPLAETSEQVLNLSIAQGHKVYTTAISFANITYFVQKYRSNELRPLLKELIDNIYIADTTALEIQKAIAGKMKDLEDAYQYQSALKIRGLKYFISRKTKDFHATDVPVVTPEKFLSIIS